MNFNYISLLLFLPSVAKKKEREREKGAEGGGDYSQETLKQFKL